MGDPDRGVGGVDRLAARAGGAVHVDPQVVGDDLDLDLLGLGGDQHARRRGVDAALGLGGGDALHAVHTALVLQPGPDALAGLGVALGLHGHRDVLVAAEVGLVGVDDLGLPADPLGEPQVHPEQVPGEQRGLLATLTGLDLQDDVLVVVRVARDQQQPQLLRQLLAPGLAGLHLGEELRVLGGEFAGGLDVLASLAPGPENPGDRRQLRVALGQLAGVRLVGVDGRVGQPRLEGGVLDEELFDCLEHGGGLLPGDRWVDLRGTAERGKCGGRERRRSPMPPERVRGHREPAPRER